MQPSANELQLSSKSQPPSSLDKGVGIQNRDHCRAVVTYLCIHDNKDICFHSPPPRPSHFNYSRLPQASFCTCFPLRGDHDFQTTPPSACRGITYIDYERHNKHDQDELQLGVWDVTQEDLLKLQRRKHLKALFEQLCCEIFAANWLLSYTSSLLARSLQSLL